MAIAIISVKDGRVVVVKCLSPRSIGGSLRKLTQRRAQRKGNIEDGNGVSTDDN